MADSLIPVEMQRTMFAMMLAVKMVNVQQPSPSHRECAHRLHLYASLLKSLNATCRYRNRMNDLMLNFGAKLSDIEAIIVQMSIAECELKQHQAQLKWWKRTLQTFLRRFTNKPERILEFLPTLDSGQIIEMTTKDLGAALPVHLSFRKSALCVVNEPSATDLATQLKYSELHESSGSHQPHVYSHVTDGGAALSRDDAEDSVAEMSSLSQLSCDSFAMNADTSRHH
jgi:hypothetical protein